MITMKLKVNFVGRKVNACGIFYPIEVILDVDIIDEEIIRIGLYNEYEHIRGLKISRVEEGEQ